MKCKTKNQFSHLYLKMLPLLISMNFHKLSGSGNPHSANMKTDLGCLSIIIKVTLTEAGRGLLPNFEMLVFPFKHPSNNSLKCCFCTDWRLLKGRQKKKNTIRSLLLTEQGQWELILRTWNSTHHLHRLQIAGLFIVHSGLPEISL